MDTQSPEWEEYHRQFMELADLADSVEPPAPPLDECQYYLCLYGENGMSAEDEFQFLANMDAFVGDNLKKVEIQTSYWEDIVLFVP